MNDSGHGGHESDSDLPESLGDKATNKQVIEFLRQLISGLRKHTKRILIRGLLNYFRKVSQMKTILPNSV